VNCICPNGAEVYINADCPVHGDGLTGCTCQYRGTTPKWYVSVKTCPVHAAEYAPSEAPEWAETMCGEGGAEVWRDRQRLAQ